MIFDWLIVDLFDKHSLISFWLCILFRSNYVNFNVGLKFIKIILQSKNGKYEKSIKENVDDKLRLMKLLQSFPPVIPKAVFSLTLLTFLFMIRFREILYFTHQVFLFFQDLFQPMNLNLFLLNLLILRLFWFMRLFARRFKHNSFNLLWLRF